MSSNQFYMGLVEIFLNYCIEMIFLSNFSFFGILDFRRKICITFAPHLVVDWFQFEEPEPSQAMMRFLKNQRKN